MQPAYPAPRRDYVHHTTATVKHIRQNYRDYTIPQIAAQLGIDASKIKALARREGIKKRKSLF